MSQESGREVTPTGRRARKLAVGAAVAAAVAGVLYLGAGLLLQTLLDPATVARWAEPRMERALNRPVELGGVDVSLFPGLGVELRDLAIASPEGMDAPEFARVERLRLGVALLPLLRRRVEVDEAVAEGATVRLLVTADGRSNFGDFVPRRGGDASSAGDAGPPLSLEIRELRLERGRLSYRDLRHGRSLEAAEVSARVRLDRTDGGWTVEGRAAVDSLRAEGVPGAASLDGIPVELTLAGRAGPEFRRLEVSSGSARLGPVELGISGRVDSLRSPVRRLDLRLRARELPLADVVALTRPGGGRPAAGEAEGTLELDLEVSGGLGPEARPAVTGLVALRGGRYRDAGGTTLADDVEAEAVVERDSVILRRLEGRLLGGPVEADGTLGLEAGRPFAGRVRATPRLERVPGADGESLQVSGAVALDLEVRGRLDAPASTRARGAVRPEGVEVRRPGWRGPVGVPSGTVRLEGDAATASDLPVVVAGDSLRVEGRLTGVFSRLEDPDARPSVDASATGRRLDLRALFPPTPGDPPSYARLAFAHLGGRLLDGRSATEAAAARRLSRPGAPPVTGEVRIRVDELLWAPWRLTDAAARLVLRPDRIEVRDAGFGVLGGRASGSLSLGLGPALHQPFSLSLRAEEVAGRELLERLTPVGPLISGTTSLELTVDGALDTLLLPRASGLTGEGRLAARRGQLRENPVTGAVARALGLDALRQPSFESFVVPFSLQGDTVRLASSTLRADSVTVRLDGVLGLAGALGLGARLQLPRRVVSGLSLPGGAAGQAVKRLLGGSGPAELGLRIGGTTARPEVKLDLQGVAGPGGVREQARQEVKDALREGARGLLGRVLGERGARRDTASRDTVPPDSAGTEPDTAGGG